MLWSWPPAPCVVGGGGLWGVCVLWSWPPAPCGGVGGSMGGLCVVELATCTMWGWGMGWGEGCGLLGWGGRCRGCSGVGHLDHVEKGGVGGASHQDFVWGGVGVGGLVTRTFPCCFGFVCI